MYFGSVLGVVGVDVPLEKIESLLKYRLSGDTYGFLVDRSDLATIVHPFAKPTAEVSLTLFAILGVRICFPILSYSI